MDYFIDVASLMAIGAVAGVVIIMLIIIARDIWEKIRWARLHDKKW